MPVLRFGTPGIPVSTSPRDTINGIKQVRKLGLSAMEMEFVHSVNVSSDKAPEVKKCANENDVTLTCHGQYFINLAAIEKAKREASISRMILAAKRVHECGGWSVTWHAAFYLGRQKEKVYPLVKDGFARVVGALRDEGLTDVWIRPETTGKNTQWGDLAETLKLSQDVEQVLPCIDFGHLHARDNGKNNTTAEFRNILSQVEKSLGKEGLRNMHIQVTGIAYGEKGEKHHLEMKDSDFNYKDLIKVWKEFNIAGVVINESPNIEKDALLLKKEYESIE